MDRGASRRRRRPGNPNQLYRCAVAIWHRVELPGEHTNLQSTAARVATSWAFAPTDNLISEFLPDIARRIHVRVVIVQQIINQVAKTEP